MAFLPLKPDTTGLFGTGTTDLVVSSTTNLSGDSEYMNVTVTSTGELNTSGYMLRVRGTLTIQSSGRVHNDGSSGVIGTTTAGGAGGSGGGTGGWMYAGTTSGGSGGGPSSSGNDGGDFSSDLTYNYGRTGGAGGNSKDLKLPGTYGSVRNTISPYDPVVDMLMRAPYYETATRRGYDRSIHGGSGGGGGQGGTYGAGGGGGGGGIVWIAARNLDSSGTITARGGPGGPGRSGNVSSVISDPPGGGGGGGGGAVIMFVHNVISLGTITASGGAGGEGAYSGSPGSGYGSNGDSGLDGNVKVYRV